MVSYTWSMSFINNAAVRAMLTLLVPCALWAESAIYRNTWKKTDLGWKIAERVLFTDRFAGQ